MYVLNLSWSHSLTILHLAFKLSHSYNSILQTSSLLKALYEIETWCILSFITSAQSLEYLSGSDFVSSVHSVPFLIVLLPENIVSCGNTTAWPRNSSVLDYCLSRPLPQSHNDLERNRWHRLVGKLQRTSSSLNVPVMGNADRKSQEWTICEENIFVRYPRIF